MGSGGSLSLPRFSVVWGFMTCDDGGFAMIKNKYGENNDLN
jgi:hypothetical protein